MATIIVEGADFSGKSTFVARLAKDLKAVVLKEERIPYPDTRSITEWIATVNSMSKGRTVICDRSVLISDAVYGPIIRGSYQNPEERKRLMDRFSELAEKPTVVFCNPGWEAVSRCSNEQMEGVKNNLRSIYNSYLVMARTLYDRHLCRVIEYNYLHQDYETQLSALRVATTSPDQEMSQVAEFHRKFGIEGTPAGWKDPELQEFRVKFLMEEIQEFRDSLNLDDPVKSLDALLDLVYVAKGTALMMGVTPQMWSAGFDKVHSCNMAKRRVKSADESKRGSSYDVVKPEGWTGPEEFLADLFDYRDQGLFQE